MKVLMVTPAYLPQVGGLENTVHALSKALHAEGVLVEVAHLDVFSSRYRMEMVDDVRVHRIPLRGFRLFGWAKGFARLARKFDLLHVHDPQLMAVSVNVFLQKGATPIVLSTHGGYRHTTRLGRFKQWHERYLMPAFLSKYSKVLPSSQADFSYFGKFSSNIDHCSNGVDIGSFAKIHRTNLNVNRWLYWGRLARHKRLDSVLALIKQLNNAGQSIELTICGPDFDGTGNRLQTLIQDEGLSKQVRLLGLLTQEQLLSEVAQHGVYVSASEHEGFGVTLVEAMASGMLVICRDRPPMNDLGLDQINVCRLQFDKSDSDLRKLTEFLGRSSQEILRVSEMAKTDATQFEWAKVVKTYLNVYHRAH